MIRSVLLPISVLLAFSFAASAQPAAERITAINDLARGSTATIQGSVERILDEDEFRISDASGSIKVYIGPNLVPVEVGEKITVRGFVDNDLRKELYARELVRANGDVVRFDRRYD